mmetsp:Transcript_124706/g.364233  ORF Transcript_124706/g.364233 Transcript_124706/m.364233 type:complete len:202 (+) Transcript_124706:198-803(+)
MTTISSRKLRNAASMRRLFLSGSSPRISAKAMDPANPRPKESTSATLKSRIDACKLLLRAHMLGGSATTNTFWCRESKYCRSQRHPTPRGSSVQGCTAATRLQPSRSLNSASKKPVPQPLGSWTSRCSCSLGNSEEPCPYFCSQLVHPQQHSLNKFVVAATGVFPSFSVISTCKMYRHCQQSLSCASGHSAVLKGCATRVP